MKIKAIITGTTGMVGKGILIECLESEKVESILVINRRSIGISHPKLKEVILTDFTKFETIKKDLKGYNACFHCMGVSSIGMSEKDFHYYTYEMTASLANSLADVNKDLTFCYVSGTGTDSSEKGRVMWARVKGKTENLILNLGFRDAYAFRPGAIIPEKGIKSKTNWYQFFYVILKPIFPLMKKMSSITTTTKVGQAMINVISTPETLKHLENKDINRIS